MASPRSNFTEKIKALDAKEEILTTAYGDAFDVSEVQRIFENQRIAFLLDFAPRPMEISLWEKTISEEYFAGAIYNPATCSEALEFYREHIIPDLTTLISSAPSAYRFSESYLQQTDALKPLLGDLLLESGMRAASLLESCVALLSSANDVLTVRAHGDFKYTHYMFADNGQRRIIDWETLGTQSAFFDFLNPVCPWLLHHPLSESERYWFEATFAELITQFVRTLPVPSEEQRKIQENWPAYVAAFIVDRLARIRSNPYDRPDRDLDVARRRVMDGAQLFCELMQIKI